MIKEIAIALGEVGLGDWSHVGCGAAALQSLTASAGGSPRKPVGYWPGGDEQVINVLRLLAASQSFVDVAYHGLPRPPARDLIIGLVREAHRQLLLDDAAEDRCRLRCFEASVDAQRCLQRAVAKQLPHFSYSPG